MAKSAVVKKMFQKPTQKEVEEFMYNNMKDWPVSFCQWYADIFWNHYQSVGWRVANRLMTSWPAAFHARWKNLKWDSKKKLEELQMEPIHQLNMAKRRKEEAGLFGDAQGQLENAAKIDLNLIRLTELQRKVIAGEADKTKLWEEYDALKRMGIMKVPKEQIDQIMILKGESNQRGKSLMVEYLFRNLNHYGKTIKQFYYEIHAKANDQ